MSEVNGQFVDGLRSRVGYRPRTSFFLPSKKTEEIDKPVNNFLDAGPKTAKTFIAHGSQTPAFRLGSITDSGVQEWPYGH